MNTLHNTTTNVIQFGFRQHDDSTFDVLSETGFVFTLLPGQKVDFETPFGGGPDGLTYDAARVDLVLVRMPGDPDEWDYQLGPWSEVALIAENAPGELQIYSCVTRDDIMAQTFKAGLWNGLEWGGVTFVLGFVFFLIRHNFWAGGNQNMERDL